MAPGWRTRWQRREFFRLLILLLLSCTVAAGQQTQRQPQVAAAAQSTQPGTAARLYPESGFLSLERYTSACFGFSIDLPGGQPMRMLHTRIPASGEHWLLAVELGGADRVTRVQIRARRERGDSAKPAAQAYAAELNTHSPGWGRVVRDQLGPLSAWRFENGGSSYVFHHAVLWFVDLPGCTPDSRYLLEFSTDSADPDFDARLQKAMEAMQMFTPKTKDAVGLMAAARQQAGADASPYDGGALPSDLVDESIAAKPGRRIDPGEWKGNHYSNTAVGIRFDAPEGFQVLDVDEASRILALAQDLTLGRSLPDRRHELWRACSRTLAVVEDSEHSIAPGVAPAAVLVLTRRDCMPDLKPPENMNDHEAVQTFTELLLRATEITEMHKGFMREHGARRLFALEGSAAFKREGEALASRFSMRLTATLVGDDYLLTIFAVAENDEGLRRLEERVGIEY